MNNNSNERLDRAYCALEGLSVGDGFGERWFYIPTDLLPGLIKARALPAPMWDYTDDTQMALSIVSILRQHNGIEQDQLALSFAKRYERGRKYGASMRGLFLKISEGVSWQEAAGQLFDGMGSFGNGAAMRVAPVGAYFADDLAIVIEQAQRSAEVTHAHPEGIAGAIAVAAATALAWQAKQAGVRPTQQEFLEYVLPYVPPSEVHSKIRRAQNFSDSSATAQDVVPILGNGSGISAQDTVAFCLWCAGKHLDNYEEAIWLTASGFGDVDTTCAIVGGIVSMYVGIEGIPANWIASREPLPSWPFLESR